MATSLSIITPSLNQSRFIERTIRSVLSQDVPGIEYVICDGGSTDGTLEILRRFDSQIDWCSEPDGGQADAVNKGILRTSGEVIGWLNSDDIYYPRMLEKVCAFFDSNSEIDVIYGQANHINEDDSLIAPYPTELWNLERLKEVCFLCQPAVFFRRRVVDRFGLLDSKLRFCMDYEYWIRLALSGSVFSHQKQIFAGSRMYAENKTKSFLREVHAEINDMLLEKLGNVPDSWIFNYAHAVLESRGKTREHKFRFVADLSLNAFIASIKWNRTMSKGVRRTILEWLSDGLVNKFEGENWFRR